MYFQVYQQTMKGDRKLLLLLAVLALADVALVTCEAESDADDRLESLLEESKDHPEIENILRNVVFNGLNRNENENDYQYGKYWVLLIRS